MKSDDELLLVLLYLKGVFQPDSFRFFEDPDVRRHALVENLAKPFDVVWKIAHNMYCPDFTLLEQSVESLSFIQCAAYMMFYLRLAQSQGGAEWFIKLWKNGTALRLTQRMLDTLDT